MTKTTDPAIDSILDRALELISDDDSIKRFLAHEDGAAEARRAVIERARKLAADLDANDLTAEQVSTRETVLGYCNDWLNG